MANYSDLTRKEQVLSVLKSRAGQWVNGADLANEHVGGSEGLKRLRELKNEGWLIQKRHSPVQGSDQFQYRLAVQLRTDGELAYRDPTLHPEDKKEVQNGGPARSDPDPRRDPAPHPAQSTWMDPNVQTTESSLRDWKPAKKTPGVLEHEFWIDKHQRAYGGIAEMGVDRWGWGVRVPGNKTKGTREIRAGHGVVTNKVAAVEAVEAVVRKLRDERGFVAPDRRKK